VRKSFFLIPLALWALFLGLFPKQDVSQLLRLPVLITHYLYEHLPAEADLSFTEYLVEHYFNGEYDATDGHNELPFYHLKTTGSLWYIPALYAQLLYPHWLNGIRIATINTKLPILLFIHSIFQPPQTRFLMVQTA